MLHLMKFYDILLKEYHDEALLVLGAILSISLEESREEAIQGLKSKIPTKDDTKLNRLKMGHFSVMDLSVLTQLYAEKNGGDPRKNGSLIITPVMERLVNAGIVIPSPRDRPIFCVCVN